MVGCMINLRFLAFALFSVWVSMGCLLASEPNKGGWQASLEISTKHVWRGLEFGSSPILFPGLTYRHGGFSAYAMGGYATNASHQEVDFGVSYSFKNWTLGLNDYYYPSNVGESDSYFNYNRQQSKHWVELYATYSGTKLPIWMTLTTFVYGADKQPSGKQAYSTYCELGYIHQINPQSSLSAIAGFSPNKSFYSAYDSYFAWTTFTLRYSHDVRIGSYTLPVSVSYLFNPHIKKSFFSCSIVLKTP